jgi:16S rRNA (guanine527-N7)-methyltransferase
MTPSQQLYQGLQALQLNLTTSVQTQLLTYLELLTQWNRVYNLTAVREITQMIPKHLLDSLAVLPYLTGPSILDVGTGAGIPGLILAMAQPNWQYTLLDSNTKKIRFIQQAIIELQINNVQTISTRLERFSPTIEFNTIISRAYADLYQFYMDTKPLLTPNNCLVAMKGIYPQAEIDELKPLPIQVASFTLQIPQLAAQRHLIILRSH